VKTKASKSIEEHPVKALFDEGVEIVPCSDDVLMDDSLLSDEIFLLHTKKGFNLGEIIKVLDNGFKYSFHPDAKAKKELRKDAFSSSLKVLRKAGFLETHLTQFPQIKQLREELDV